MFQNHDERKSLTLTSVINIMTKTFCRLPNDLALFMVLKHFFTFVAVGVEKKFDKLSLDTSLAQKLDSSFT